MQHYLGRTAKIITYGCKYIHICILLLAKICKYKCTIFSLVLCFLFYLDDRIESQKLCSWVSKDILDEVSDNSQKHLFLYKKYCNMIGTRATNLGQPPWQPLTEEHIGLDEGKHYTCQILELPSHFPFEQVCFKKRKEKISFSFLKGPWSWCNTINTKKTLKTYFFSTKKPFSMLQSTAYALFQSCWWKC